MYVRKPLMVDILNGKVFSRRHDDFISGCRKRGKKRLSNCHEQPASGVEVGGGGGGGVYACGVCGVCVWSFCLVLVWWQL